jgi:hypothetical protein
MFEKHPCKISAASMLQEQTRNANCLSLKFMTFPSLVLEQPYDLIYNLQGRIPNF